ncbi:MAG: hypothetical protein LBT46_12945 [Planctomycetaceae bacterium]|jgi:hypothetical protein|nr:hypothetical protein [Planctomycetaceae bacterium]
MSRLVEKLAAAEQEITGILPNIETLVSQADAFTQRIAAFAGQSSDIAEKAVVIRQDAAAVEQSLKNIRTLIAEVKTEAEAFITGQKDNQQRCETMTAVFGEAFQAVSSFFETAQRLGLTDQAKTPFLPQALTVESRPESAPVLPPPALPTPAFEESGTESPVVEEPAVEKPVTEEPVSGESVVDEPAAEKPVAEKPFVEAAAAPVLPDLGTETETEAVSDMDTADIDSANTDSADIASNLDISPLNLGTMPPDSQTETEPDADSGDEQDIEDMLADMMKPVTV